MKTQLEMTWYWLIARIKDSRSENGASGMEYALLVAAAFVFASIIIGAVTGALQKIVAQFG